MSLPSIGVLVLAPPFLSLRVGLARRGVDREAREKIRRARGKSYTERSLLGNTRGGLWRRRPHRRHAPRTRRGYMCPADNKPTQLQIHAPAETEVGPQVNPHRHVPVVTADQDSVDDNEFLVAHGLVLMPSSSITQDTPGWVGFGFRSFEKRANLGQHDARHEPLRPTRHPSPAEHCRRLPSRRHKNTPRPDGRPIENPLFLGRFPFGCCCMNWGSWYATGDQWRPSGLPSGCEGLSCPGIMGNLKPTKPVCFH
jgi:hypothetical protein